MSEWKGIESAPKDGTRILLVCGPEYEVARWSQPEGCWLGANRVLYPNAVTKWTELPAPPVLGDGREQEHEQKKEKDLSRVDSQW
jgi:hypothetical protein